jgi:hypothetical protein
MEVTNSKSGEENTPQQIFNSLFELHFCISAFLHLIFNPQIEAALSVQIFWPLIKMDESDQN